jgi:hypothetical protein
LALSDGFGHNISRLLRGILFSKCIAPDRSPTSLHFLFSLQDAFLELIDTLGLLRTPGHIEGSLSAEDVTLELVRRDIIASLSLFELAKHVFEFGLCLRSSFLGDLAFTQIGSEIDNRGLGLGSGGNRISEGKREIGLHAESRRRRFASWHGIWSLPG